MGQPSNPTRERRRNYARYRAPRELVVGWKTSNQRTVSRVTNVGMGGLFLETKTPPKTGSIIELIFDLPTGEIRARATVRDSKPGKGMGIQFVHMQPEVRARLNRFLASQIATSEGDEVKKAAAEKNAARGPVPDQWAQSGDSGVFEGDIQKLLELARKGTYYQLLGVTSESPNTLIKQRFYGLARKFHPDRHMEKKELVGSLKDLMGVVAEGYRTLSDPQKRADYDKKLSDSGAFGLHRGPTTVGGAIEECLKRANECLRVQNFVGSIVWLRKCVDLAPDEARYHAMLGRSLSVNAELRNEAIDHLSKAIELDPWLVETRMQLAELYYEETHLEWRARELYLKVLELSPGHAKASRRMAELDAVKKS